MYSQIQKKYTMNRSLFLSAMLCSLCGVGIAQTNQTVKGKVVDKSGLTGKIGVCCHSGLAERNAEYHDNFIFYRD